MLQDYKLGFRMLVKYPGLTVAGSLALAIAIAIGAGWYDLSKELFSPTIPLPDGDRLVSIDTRNILTNEYEFRVARDFLDWRRELRTIEDLGAFRPAPRNLIVNGAVPTRIQMVEITAAAFRAARVSTLLGRALLDSDEMPGAPGVVVLGYDVWQQSLGARQDVIGLNVRLGEKPATVVGVMPEGFGYPFNYHAWSPLQLRASYGPLEGDAISVIGRLAPGMTRAQADAELGVLSEQTAKALPATHEHLRSRTIPPGEPGDADIELSDIAQFAITNLPVLLVLLIACMSVGTLFYARTATRDGEIALRSALGATRGRIIFQLFVEALVLSVLAAGVGLFAADQILRWGTQGAYTDEGGLPFWINPGLALTTIVYAGGLAIVTAVMVSLLPALRATRAEVQSHLTNLGTGGATLRFGRVWTSAMIAQVALTAIGIPVAMEGASQVMRTSRIRAEFPTREYLAARIDVDPPVGERSASALEERRARLYSELEQRVAQEPGVAAVTFSNRVPGSALRGRREADVELLPGAGAAFDFEVWSLGVGPGFFEIFDRPILAGRGFNGGDWTPTGGAVIVNEAFVRGFRLRGGGESPIGARLRYSDSSATSQAEAPAAAVSENRWLEIVGIVRNIGLDPDDEGDEVPQVFQPASAGTVSPLVMTVRTRVNPATLVARLPVIAADVNPVWSVQDARPLDQWQNGQMDVFTAALVTVNSVVLFLSALGIFSLLSVSVSRQTREIGLRMALGEDPRHLLAGILSRAMVLMGSGVAIGAFVLLAFVIALDADDLAKFAGWLVVTAAVMLSTGLIASIEPARRALRINPIDALRQTT